MAESAAAGQRGGGVAKALFTPNPSIPAWQGIVEICLRVAVLVLAVLALISAGVANSDSQFADVFAGGLANLLRARDGVISASGWIIFVAIAVLVIEGVILAIRFLNFGFVESYSTIVFIVDIVISGVIAGAYLSGAIALAVNADDWRDFAALDFNNSPINPGRIASSAAATSAFSFLSVFVFVGLLVWMVLTVVLKWGKGGKHSDKSSTEAAD